jgi:hypothetical protein
MIDVMNGDEDHRGPPINPTPNSSGYMSAEAKVSLADIALALREEQLDAQVIHYRADLATNPDLDAITAQVVHELQDLQAAVRIVAPISRPVSVVDAAEIESELARSLQDMLAKIFRRDRLTTVIERSLGEVAKRFARVFFESELAAKIHGTQDELKTMRFQEQALFHALHRVESLILATFETFEYEDPSVRERAQQRYYQLLKDLRNEYLARTTPELNTLISYLNEVLSEYFRVEMPPALQELSAHVVADARLADSPKSAGYKISAATFPTFRQAFERRFMHRLVFYVEDEMLTRVRNQSDQFRDETIRLIADPIIFSDVCGVVCEAVYDMLYNDGFLDLPADWRAHLYAGGGE